MIDSEHSSIKNVSVRLEGGAGDCLLGNRFIPAIQEKYPNTRVTAYIDSEGKTFQKELLGGLYGHLYENINVIPKKKYKEFWVDCQFGVDNYHGALENVPDDIRDEMMSYDKFYDLHIDSLKFIDFDFDWYSRFYYFPKPKIKQNEHGDYAIFHLQSATSDGHQLEKWYCEKLVGHISRRIKCYIVCMESQVDFYDWVSDMDNVELFIGDIFDVCSMIGNARVFVSVDSGFRYVAYGAGVPTVTFSKHCVSPHRVLRSHELRWLLFPYQCFPLNYSCSAVSNLVLKILENKAYGLFPFVQDFDAEMVRRRYTINWDKTVG